MDNTKKLIITAQLLGICIASQFLKNISTYITGSIINTALIICTIKCSYKHALMLSFILPITSIFITGNPLMSAIPLIAPCVMMGNCSLVLCIQLLKNKLKMPYYLVIGSIVKALLMWLLIVKIVLPLTFAGSGLPAVVLASAKISFSITQLITALIGSIIAIAFSKIIKPN